MFRNAPKLLRLFPCRPISVPRTHPVAAVEVHHNHTIGNSILSFGFPQLHYLASNVSLLPIIRPFFDNARFLPFLWFPLMAFFFVQHSTFVFHIVTIVSYQHNLFVIKSPYQVTSYRSIR